MAVKIAAAYLTLAILIGGCRCGDEELGVKISERFGYDPDDSTKILQAAFDSGIRKLILDRQSGPWITLPLKMRSNTELVIESGVELLAKRGAFRGTRDFLLELPHVENCIIRGGKGAMLRMWKQDYQGPEYEHGEWRYGLRLFHVTNVLVEGICVAESGGDGVGITGKDVTIRNCVFDKNHRQGISVFSAENLLIDKCVLSNTSGTAPMAGIDLEPDNDAEKLVNVVIRDTLSINNQGNGFEMYFLKLTDMSEPVSIRFENCRSVGNKHSAWVNGGWKPDCFVSGGVEFRNCLFDSPVHGGIYISGSPASAFDVRFADCVITNAPIAVKFVTSAFQHPMPDGIILDRLTVFHSSKNSWFSSYGQMRGEMPSSISGSVKVVRPDLACEDIGIDSDWVSKNHSPINGGRPLASRVSATDIMAVEVSDARPGEYVDLPPMCFVRGSRFVFCVEKPGLVKFRSRQFTVVKGRSANRSPYVIRALDAKDAPGREWKVPSAGFEAKDWVFNAPAAGFYSLEIAQGETRFILEKCSVPIAIDVTVKEQVITPLRKQPISLWFSNPRGGAFTFAGIGDEYNRFAMTILDPEGKTAYENLHVNTTAFYTREVAVPRGLWQVSFRDACKDGVFDWITLDLYGAQGYFFLTKDRVWSLK